MFTLQEYIISNKLFFQYDSIILAVSGGKDSMALLHYLYSHNYRMVVAHCNFKLRGAASDLDADFIKNYCKKHDIPYRGKQFDTEKLAKENGTGIQETARKLRYDWLEKIRFEENAVAVVTAHHLDDNIETVLFKLIKGTGIKGIRGMKPKHENIARPLLITPLSDILSYIELHDIPYREDYSNARTTYSRNKIRLKLMPLLLDINPGLHKTFSNHFERWQDLEKLHNAIIEKWEKTLISKNGYDEIISIHELQHIPGFKTLLFYIVQKRGFNASDTKDMVSAFDSREPKQFQSSSHRILLDKRFIYITPLRQLNDSTVHYMYKNTRKIAFEQGILRIGTKPIKNLSKIHKGQHYAYLDARLLKFPLTIRKCKTGDYFYPYGLSKKNGKPVKKKLNKFLNDNKMSARDKENQWVLLSGDRIAWVINQRIDYRFAISSRTTNVLVIQYVTKAN